LIIGSLVWVFSFIFFTFWSIIAEKVGYEFKYRYLQAVLRQEAAWYDEKETLELPSKISQECAKIQKATGEKFIMIYYGIGTSCGGFISAFAVGWKYAFAALGTMPILILGLCFLTVGIKLGYAKSVKSYAKSGAYAEQALNNMKVVAAFGQEKREIDNYVKHLDEAKRQSQIGRFIIVFSLAIMNFLIFFAYAYGLFVGGQFVNAGIYNVNKGRNYTSGDIISTFFGVIIGIFSVGTSAPNFKVVTEGRISAYNALEVINREPTIRIDDVASLPCDHIKTDIILENVSFKYTSREAKALNNITCTIEHGKTTAFVGPSGSGKSTIVKLIERFYDPDEGSVIVNGEDLKRINLRQYRHKIGYVGQEPVLFNESIKANMLNAKPDATNEEIMHALKIANAMIFVNRLKEGIDTNAGSSGGQLSGGEKQRIALARAFLKKPDVLILDEATSALDRRNESEVQKAIENLHQEANVTVIVIAHRLSTIRNADKIVVIDNGEIKEVGDHENLLNEFPDGVYSQLVRTQDSEDNKDEDGFKKLGSKTSLQNNDDDDVEVLASSMLALGLNKTICKDDEDRKKEKDLTEEVDKEDQIEQEGIDAARIQRKKAGFKGRLFKQNKPAILVFIGIIFGMIAGSVFPVFAIVWTKVLFVMMDDDNMGSQLLLYCGLLVLIGVVSFTSTFIEKFSFGLIAENMSRNIREETYGSILRRHIGWFDMPENTPGQLTNILSTEVNTLNGASTESIAVMFEGFVGLLTGVALALVFEWRISLVALGITPIMILSGAINAKVKAGNLIDIERSDIKTNSLVSDSVLNYTTVASFANEHVLIDKYRANLLVGVNKEVKKCYISGFLFGFSQFMQFGMYTILFWSGAQFVKNYNVDGQDLFTAIYIMMFASMGAGQAQQHGPSAGLGILAAAKIYDIIDERSTIDPMKISEQEIIATKQNIKGEIEFRNVWFRYPTRKDNWILKGLSMMINPNECIGLVGQSGGGKSTIIQLLFRFYDPQRGEIFIDGHDIKSYNIRSLRAQFGLVQQEPVLFNYSVKDNICYAKEQATTKEVIDAAEIANAKEFIENSESNDTDETVYPESALEPLRGSDFSQNSYEELPPGYNTL
jgi:ATP-binding cassette subfamily B (MDR/TAP) protein 1